MKDDKHFDIKSLIAYYKQNWQHDPLFTNGFNLIVYTHSAMLTTLENEFTGFDLTVLKLSSMAKRDEFKEKVKLYFESDTTDMLVIYADVLNDSKNRINICRSIINSTRLDKPENDNAISPKHVVFIIRIEQSREEIGLSFGRQWRQYTVDILNGSGNTTISIKDILNKNIDDLIIASISQE